MTVAPFHIHLYGPLLSDGPQEPPATASTCPIESSFESAQGRLEQHLPAVLLEPDGSFAWAGPNHQVVGMIYDAAEKIQYIELRGRCAGRQLRRLIETLAGTDAIDQFAVMVLPERQWKVFQSFEKTCFPV